MKHRPARILAILIVSLLTPGIAVAADKILTVAASVFPDNLKAGTLTYAGLSLVAIDPTTMRFHLRQGVKFSDGVEFTADDVVFTLNRVQEPKAAYGQAARISQVQSTIAVNKYTVDIKTKSIFPTLILGLSDILIEPKHYYEKVGAEAVASRPMGTGPFIFQEWVPGDHYTLGANKNYWGGAPKVDKLLIRAIPDGSSRVAALVSRS